MQIAKRVFLFALVNVLVVTTIMLIVSVFHVQRYFPRTSIEGIAIWALIWGFGGAFISLLISRWMAKAFKGVQVIPADTDDPELRGLVRTVHELARRAGLTTMPEVGIYESAEINAFATGPSRSRALVAVSSGLLNAMPSSESAAVLGHEITHVANGDMVTMMLIQGVINSFVIFVAYLLTFMITQAMRSRDDRDSGFGGGWFMQQMIFQIVQIPLSLLGMLVVCWFSRWREFRADAGGARLGGRDNMIHALQTLERIEGAGPAYAAANGAATTDAAFECLKISSPRGFMRLLMTHPPMEERIAALEKLKV